MKHPFNSLPFLLTIVVSLVVLPVQAQKTKCNKPGKAYCKTNYTWDKRTVVSSVLTDIKIHDTLKVMTWNMKFGGGRVDYKLDCWGDSKCICECDALKHLDGICALINQFKPHVLYLQEVDILSRRSGYIDQLKYIVNHTYLNYGVYYPQMVACWSLAEKYVNTGSAILSVNNLKNTTRVFLPTEALFLKRNIIKAEISVNGQEIVLMNTHTIVGGASKKKIAKTKIASRDSILNVVKMQFDQNPLSKIVLGGDFNNTPYTGSVSIPLKDFADAKCKCIKGKSSDYTRSKNLMKPFYSETFPLKPVIENPDLAKNHTCSLKDTIKWSRKLDYIFTNIPVGSAKTLQKSKDTGVNPNDFSDHAPIVTTLLLK